MDEENENAAIEKVAHTIVKKVIRAAQEYYLNNVQKEEGKVLALFAVSYCVSELSQKDFHSILSFSEAEYTARNIQWTTCESFTVERGLQQIEEYISVSDHSNHSVRLCPLTVEQCEKWNKSTSVPFSTSLWLCLLDRVCSVCSADMGASQELASLLRVSLGRRSSEQQEVPLQSSLEHPDTQKTHPTSNSKHLFCDRDLKNQTCCKYSQVAHSNPLRHSSQRPVFLTLNERKQ